MIQNLPIVKYLNQIVNLVKQNGLTIIATPTGSGKTLLVPAWLQDRLQKNVIVTVPRVLLAKSAREGAVKFVYGKENAVGVQTGKGDKFPNAPLKFVTEGTFSIRLYQHLQPEDILVVDEVHEQGVNTEEVLYLAVQHLLRGGKVVLMSATIHLDKYFKYYNSKGISVAVFEMPEPKRPFETEVIVQDDPIKYITSNGGRWLIGVDGKEGINNMADILNSNKWSGKIFPLHSEIEEWEEEEALSFRGECVYIATSVAMSGITFPELDGVLVPHLGKRIEGHNLVNYALSKAEQKQWEGRVGRTKDGIALYDTKTFNYEGREENVTPEILRIPTKNIVLSFASKGYDLATIELLNQPAIEEIQFAKDELFELGCLDETGITQKGIWIHNAGMGVDGGLFAYEGAQLGIEATARKIAVLIENGTPYRKGNTPFGRQLVRSCPICAISDHYRIVRMIQEDEQQHFGQGAIFEIVKKYGEDHNIFLRGVNKMKRDFDWIDRNYEDEVEIGVEIIKTLFSLQNKQYLFQHGTNEFFGKIVEGYGVFANIYGKCYATPAPITLKKGRIIQMATEI